MSHPLYFSTIPAIIVAGVVSGRKPGEVFVDMQGPIVMWLEQFHRALGLAVPEFDGYHMAMKKMSLSEVVAMCRTATLPHWAKEEIVEAFKEEMVEGEVLYEYEEPTAVHGDDCKCESCSYW